jgi:hypothetical protein
MAWPIGDGNAFGLGIRGRVHAKHDQGDNDEKPIHKTPHSLRK